MDKIYIVYIMQFDKKELKQDKVKPYQELKTYDYKEATNYMNTVRLNIEKYTDNCFVNFNFNVDENENTSYIKVADSNSYNIYWIETIEL